MKAIKTNREDVRIELMETGSGLEDRELFHAAYLLDTADERS